MNRENKEVTLTLEDLAKALAITAAKYIGEDSDWASKNWKIFFEAACKIKDIFGVDQVTACHHCYVVYSPEDKKCPNCGEANKS